MPMGCSTSTMNAAAVLPMISLARGDELASTLLQISLAPLSKG
jgi:hypothetical protein